MNNDGRRAPDLDAPNSSGRVTAVDSGLEELKRQRAAVAQHLAWLDAQITRARIDPAVPPPIPLVEPPESSSRARVREVIPPEAEILRPSRQGLSQTQRFGCIALAVLVAGAAMIVLWVLPLLLYD